MHNTVELFCHQVGNYVEVQFLEQHTHPFDTHTHKNLIWQDHCAKSPFLYLNIASSKKYLKHVLRCTRADAKPYTGNSLISRAFVSPGKLQVSLAVSNLPTLTPPLSF